MATALYDLTIPAFVRGFAAMSAFLAKGEQWAVEHGIDPAILLAAKLYDDMAPLTAQVQRASDTAKNAVVRLGGVPSVAMIDDEQTFADLHARIAKTVDFLIAVPADAMNGQEDRPVQLVIPGRTIPFTGRSYLTAFALPNFYFHLTTAYALLRTKGVPVGKLDYLGTSDR